MQLDWFQIPLHYAISCMLGLIFLLWYYVVHCRITFCGDYTAIPYYNACFVALYFETIQKVINSNRDYQEVHLHIEGHVHCVVYPVPLNFWIQLSLAFFLVQHHTMAFNYVQ